MTLLHLSVLLPFLFAPAVPPLFKKVPRIHTGWFVLAVPLLLFIYFLGYFPMPFGGEPIIETMQWIPSLGINLVFYVDGLSLLFTLVVTGVGALVVLYSIYYMSMEREELHKFYVYLLAFMGAMLGVVLSDNMISMYLFWELTSVSSFLLIAFWYQRKRSRYGAQKAMLITMTGGFAILLGLIMLFVMTGTFSIRETIALAPSIGDHGLFLSAMLLILLGAFTKSAQFPFHIWLPDAMEAPTPISAYLHSATMVKAGIYLVARFTGVFGSHNEWFWIITIVGLTTLFWGAFIAIRQIDLKAMLAYSTISQLGLIMSLLGVGSLSQNPAYTELSNIFAAATLTAIFHLVNHSIFKGCLFMVVGILDHETGTRDIRKLGGLMSIMPVSFTLTIIGGLSMAGMPPFSGFLSKEMFFTSMLQVSSNMDSWLVLLPIVAWVASIFTFIYCLLLVFKTFTGKYQPEKLSKVPHEAPIGMLISPIILAVLVIAFFFIPNKLAETLLIPAAIAVLPTLAAATEPFHYHISAWHGWQLELFMTIAIVLIGYKLYKAHRRWSELYGLLPVRFTLNKLYDNGLASMEKISAKITNKYMTGNSQHYMSYILAFTVFLVGGSFFALHMLSFDFSQNAPLELYEIVLGLCMVVSALFVVFSKSRFISIIAVSAVGYIMSMFLVIFRAPDLALTQLVVETITTALFVLCFAFLPKLKVELTRLRFKAINLMISLGVGLLLTLISLSVQNHKLFESISSFFEDSYTLAGAKNIVNSILVDFRGFDTMLEIVVLFMAGIGIYALIKLRMTKEDDHEVQ